MNDKLWEIKSVTERSEFDPTRGAKKVYEVAFALPNGETHSVSLNEQELTPETVAARVHEHASNLASIYQLEGPTITEPSELGNYPDIQEVNPYA